MSDSVGDLEKELIWGLDIPCSCLLCGLSHAAAWLDIPSLEAEVINTWKN